jgi:hypothetical protein
MRQREGGRWRQREEEREEDGGRDGGWEGEGEVERGREEGRETGQDIVRGGVAEKILVTEHTSCQHLLPHV